MSYSADYDCTQDELKSMAWENASSFGGLVAVVAAVVLGLAQLLGATIPPEVFVGTLLALFIVVTCVVRLFSHIPSQVEQAARREFVKNGGFRLRGK